MSVSVAYRADAVDLPRKLDQNRGSRMVGRPLPPLGQCGGGSPWCCAVADVKWKRSSFALSVYVIMYMSRELIG